MPETYPENFLAYKCGLDPFDDGRNRFVVPFCLLSIYSLYSSWKSPLYLGRISRQSLNLKNLNLPFVATVYSR